VLLAISVFLLDFLEGAEAFDFEAAFWMGRFFGFRIVETDKENSDFGFHVVVEARHDRSNDVDFALLGECRIELLDSQRELIVNANHFGAYGHKETVTR
jgi:hypothetical protein